MIIILTIAICFNYLQCNNYITSTTPFFTLCIRIVDEVLEKKTKIFANIKNVMEVLVEKQEEEAENAVAKARELFDEFNDLLSKARNQLMSKEIILHDQMEVHACDINLRDKHKINQIQKGDLFFL